MNDSKYDSLIGFAVVAVLVGAVYMFCRSGTPGRTLPPPQDTSLTWEEAEAIQRGARNVVSVPPAPVITGTTIDERLREYGHACYPEGSLEYRLGERKIDAPLSETIKRAIKERDGYKCLICGATDDLSVDHMRGRQNGGTNDVSNLATLCMGCNNGRKKSIDNSVRKQRDKLLRARQGD